MGWHGLIADQETVTADDGQEAAQGSTVRKDHDMMTTKQGTSFDLQLITGGFREQVDASLHPNLANLHGECGGSIWKRVVLQLQL